MFKLQFFFHQNTCWKKIAVPSSCAVDYSLSIPYFQQAMWQTNQNIGYYYVYRWVVSFLCILFLNILFWIVYCSFSFGFLLFPCVYNTTFFVWTSLCTDFMIVIFSVSQLVQMNKFHALKHIQWSREFDTKFYVSIKLSWLIGRIIFWLVRVFELNIVRKNVNKKPLTLHIVRRALFVDLMLSCRLKWCVSNPSPIRSFLWCQLMSNHPNYQLSRWLMMDCQRPAMLTAVYYLFRIYSKNDQHLWIIFRCSLHV